MTNELGYSELDFAQIKEIYLDQITEPNSDDLPENTKQILLVEKYSLTTANFLVSTNSCKTSSKSVVTLYGKPSPSSHDTLCKAVITFQDDSKQVRIPSYSMKTGTIRLWMHHKNLPTVLAQLNQKSIFCWIGHFANGHIYGDIHTGPEAL